MLQRLIKWLESHSVPCIIKKYAGVQCPGCGLQRAFIALLGGDLWSCFVYYPALLPILLSAVIVVVLWLLGRQNWVLWAQRLMWGNAVLVLLVYLLALLGVR